MIIGIKLKALEELNTLYEGPLAAKAQYLTKWFGNILGEVEFANYFDHQFTTSASEDINRVIKSLKCQSQVYKGIQYFSLKILQKCGYLNYRYALNDFNYFN